MARRRYQRGQLLKVGERWIARWREDVAHADGRIERIRRREVIGSLASYPTKRLAMRELEARLKDVNREDAQPVSLATFGAFAARWLAAVSVLHDGSSQASERSILRVHLLPAFGAMPLKDIRAEDIQRFVTQSDKSPKTVKNNVNYDLINTMKNIKAVSLRLDAALYEQLSSGSQLTGVPVQHMLREAIMQYIECDLDALVAFHAARAKPQTSR